MAVSEICQKSSASCSWPSGFTEEDLLRKILWKETFSEITEVAGAENCFQLKRQENDPRHCELLISLKNETAFETIVILSEESLMEVHGNHGEYLFTAQGTLLDDVDGTLLFETRIDFQKPPSDVKLKGLEMLLSSMSMRRTIPHSSPQAKDEGPNAAAALKQLEERLTQHIDSRILQLERKIDQNFALLFALLSSRKE